MTSQEENPAPVSQSLPPPMNSVKTNTEADDKPFSIRQYEFSCRQKNMLNSWPFSEKSLQMCLKESVSINDVLPPFHEPLHSSSSKLSRLRHDNNKDHVNVCKADQVPHLNKHTQNMTNECDLLSNEERNKASNHNQGSAPSHEEGNQVADDQDELTPLISSTDDESNPMLASLKASLGECKTGRRRSKIRSMVDILAEARHCTLDGDDRY